MPAAAFSSCGQPVQLVVNEDSNTSTDEAETGPLGGERLAAARRLRQMSLTDIARELRIDESKVQALEENRFEALGAPVFAKGNLRKYAEIVAVPIDDVLADYFKLNRSAGAPPIVGPPRKHKRETNLGPWLLLIPLLLVLGGAYYWWNSRPDPAAAPASASGSARALTRMPVPTVRRADPEEMLQADADESKEQMVTDSDSAEPPESPEVVEEAASNSVPQPLASNEVALQLEFSGDCWTEVSNADGDRLFFDLGKAGRTVNVRDRAPLRVLLGNSNNVSIRVDGKPYPISAADRRGDTARLTIKQPVITR